MRTARILVSLALAMFLAVGCTAAVATQAGRKPPKPTTTTTTAPTTTTTAPPTGCTRHVGDLSVSTPGAVVENVCMVDGTLICNAAGVTFRNSSSNIHDGWAILANRSCTGLRVDNVDIYCNHAPGSNGFAQDWGFVGQDIELRRLDVAGCENGVFIDNGVKLYDSYIHDPLDDSLSGAHSDGVQLWSGASDVVVSGNTVDYRGITTSAFMSSGPDPDFGHVSDVLVSDNLFGGGAATVYLPNNAGSYGFVLDNVRFVNNRWMKDAFAYYYCSGNSAEMTVWSGNVVAETGEPVPCV